MPSNTKNALIAQTPKPTNATAYKYPNVPRSFPYNTAQSRYIPTPVFAGHKKLETCASLSDGVFVAGSAEIDSACSGLDTQLVDGIGKTDSHSHNDCHAGSPVFVAAAGNTYTSQEGQELEARRGHPANFSRASLAQRPAIDTTALCRSARHKQALARTDFDKESMLPAAVAGHTDRASVPNRHTYRHQCPNRRTLDTSLDPSHSGKKTIETVAVGTAAAGIHKKEQLNARAG